MPKSSVVRIPDAQYDGDLSIPEPIRHARTVNGAKGRVLYIHATPEELFEDMTLLARANLRSRSSEMILALQEYVDQPANRAKIEKAREQIGREP